MVLHLTIRRFFILFIAFVIANLEFFNFAAQGMVFFNRVSLAFYRLTEF